MIHNFFKRLILSILIVNFLVFFVLELVSFVEFYLFQEYTLIDVLNFGLSRYIRFFFPIQIISTFFTFSFVSYDFFDRHRGRFILLLILLGLTFLSMFSREFLQPYIYYRRDNREAKTLVVEEIEERIQEAESSGDISMQISEIKRYLSINPDNEVLVEVLMDLENLFESEALSSNNSVDSNESAEENYLSEQGILDRIDESIETGDVISALYWIKKGLVFYNSRELERRLEQINRNKNDEEELSYRFKQEARILLTGQDTLEAFFYCYRLNLIYPNDPEVIQLYTDAEENLLESVFFIQEALAVRDYPGIHSIPFLFTQSAGRMLIRIGKIVSTNDGTFYFDVERFQFNNSGRITGYSYSPYGKKTEKVILLRCIDRELPLEGFIQGVSWGETLPEIIEGEDILPVLSLVRYAHSLSEANLSELFMMFRILPSLGFPQWKIQSELTWRLMIPFNQFFLLFLAVIFGLHFHKSSQLTRRVVIFSIDWIFFLGVLIGGVVLTQSILHVLVHFASVSFTLPINLTIIGIFYLGLYIFGYTRIETSE